MEEILLFRHFHEVVKSKGWNTFNDKWIHYDEVGISFSFLGDESRLWMYIGKYESGDLNYTGNGIKIEDNKVYDLVGALDSLRRNQYDRIFDIEDSIRKLKPEYAGGYGEVIYNFMKKVIDDNTISFGI